LKGNDVMAIGDGDPELHAQALGRKAGLREAIGESAPSGAPIYTEQPASREWWLGRARTRVNIEV
jgi:hypothetical protein